MKHFLSLILLSVLVFTVGCGGSKNPESAPAVDASTAPSAAEATSDVSTPEGDAQSSGELAIRDSTADAALETYIAGVRDGKLDIAIAVLLSDAPGTGKLLEIAEGMKRAAEDPQGRASLPMMFSLWAGEINALKYEKISDDGAFATFRFTKPTQETPWEIEAIKTPEGWRIRPPDSGLPQG